MSRRTALDMRRSSSRSRARYGVVRRAEGSENGTVLKTDAAVDGEEGGGGWERARVGLLPANRRVRRPEEGVEGTDGGGFLVGGLMGPPDLLLDSQASISSEYSLLKQGGREERNEPTVRQRERD